MPRPKIRNADLRATMLAWSLQTLENEGASAVTARRIAELSESSTAAVYELFGDKNGVVRDMFLAGFRQLAERLEALDCHPTARSAVIESLDAARTFALERPGLFEVMYHQPFASFQPSKDDLRDSARIYDHVVDRVADWLVLESDSTETVDAAHALVAMNRGLIANELAGLLGTSTESVQRRRLRALDAVLDGFAQPTP